MVSRAQYISWMKNQGLSSATIKKHADDTPNNLEVQRVLSSLAGSANMYNCDDAIKLQSIVRTVESMEFDIVGHKMYSAGLKKYLKFLNQN